jgi:hypothetical protein
MTADKHILAGDYITSSLISVLIDFFWSRIPRPVMFVLAHTTESRPPSTQRVPIFYTKYILGVYGSKSYLPIIEGGSYWPGVQLAIVIGSEW